MMTYEIVTALLLLLLALLIGAFFGCLFRRWSQTSETSGTSPSEAEIGKPEQSLGLAAASSSPEDTSKSNLAPAPVPASLTPAGGQDPTRKDASGKKPSQPKPKSKSRAKSATAAKSAAKKPLRARGLKSAIGGKADNLKTIRGVGPKLEKTLNGLGIFHFEQIAGWGAKDVSEVDDLLSFKGRIERDKWIAQAKKLAKK